jgi:transposase InsO family protein
MPWKEHGVLEERWKFIEDWKTDDWNMAELCRYYGVTRKTGHKWLQRYEVQGLQGLQDQSRAPRQHSNQVSPQMENAVMEIRGKHPSWGAPKIRALLLSEPGGQRIPAESTIGEILKRNGLTVPRKRRARSRAGESTCQPAEGPNAVWCADYKGWFRTSDGRRIDPLTISDHYSRYLFRCQAVDNADYWHTKAVMEAAFREYGMPQRMRTDNGAPFGSNGESGLTRLTVWWIKLGIRPEHIQPGKPQQNGRHERMHRTLKQETASPPASNRRAQQERFDQFRLEYNQERPHQALGQQPPAACYQASPRCYPERLRPMEYPAGWARRHVSPAGQIRWAAANVFVSHPLEGEVVGLEQVDEHNWRVWFGFYEIGTLDTKKQVVRRPESRPPEHSGEEGVGLSFGR